MKVIVRNKTMSHGYRGLMRMIQGGRPGDGTMLKVDELRNRQEQRLARSLESWQQAKDHLAKAIAFAEERERELHEISEDVQRKLAALDLVVGMANEPWPVRDVPTDRRLSAAENRPLLSLPGKPEEEPAAKKNAEVSLQLQSAAPDLQRLSGVLGKSSRPLFSAKQRSGLSALSILQ
jgi:hypothetical protein